MTEAADDEKKPKAKPCKKDTAKPKSKSKKEKTPEEAQKAAAKSRKSCAYHLAKRNALNAGASEEEAVQLAKEVSCKDSSMCRHYKLYFIYIGTYVYIYIQYT